MVKCSHARRKRLPLYARGVRWRMLQSHCRRERDIQMCVVQTSACGYVRLLFRNIPYIAPVLAGTLTCA